MLVSAMSDKGDLKHISTGPEPVRNSYSYRFFFTQHSALSTQHFLVAAFLCLAISSRGLALTPRDELLRLVAEDVGFCLVIDDLRGHGTALADSPFVKQFRASPLGAKVLLAEETQKLSAIDK